MEEEDKTTVIHSLNLDANAQKNFMKFFKNLGEKPATTVRFFERTDYYSCHGSDDCDLVSKITNTVIKYMEPTPNDKLCYITLSKNNFEAAIKDILLIKNFRVEVYASAGGQDGWKIEYSGSPGNITQFEDILFVNEEVNVGSSVIGVQVKTEGTSRKIGLACVEQNDCQICLIEFQDDDYFGELEAMTVLMGPKECILPNDESNDLVKIKSLMERNRILVTCSKKNDFNIKNEDIVQDLNNILRFKKGQIEDANSIPEVSLNIAVSALGAVMKYLKLTEDAGNLGNYEIKHMDFNRFVRLDAAAVSALNILPQPGSNPSSPAYHWQSVLGVLDHCCTPQGHRLMAQWIKQPLRNEATLKDRHDIVECLLDSRNALNELHDEHLKRLPDIQMAARKLLRKKATLQDVFRIYQVIMRTPKIIKTLMSLENSTINSVIINPVKSTMEDLKGLKQMVEQVVDFEAISKGEYLVNASFDDDLLSMKTRMDIIYAKMEKLLKKANDDVELDKGTVKLEYVSHLGYHFRITLKDEGQLRKNKNYKILDCVKGGVRFTSTKLEEYDQEFKELKDKFVEQQQSIVNEVIRVAIGYIGTLSSLNKSVAEIDCLVSFAISAVSAPTTYVKPKMLSEGSGILELKNIRHPCLELQSNVNFIANSVEFRKDETTMYIITGPNMGGKSTYIRSIGTTVLMAHVGAFVPCETATISMVDSIQGRIGASDNIIKGLSTFMVEMIETAGIIRSATDKSLVIIDELGRGTSTYEGCGIAWSIAEHLAKEIKCFTLFATHFHEITDISKEIPTVKNCHMAAVANKDDFVLLYEVKPGVMEKSFGIHVAKLAEFPNETVTLATQFYGEFEDENKYLKTGNDEEVLQNLLKDIKELCAADDEIDQERIKVLKEKVQNQAKSLKSNYFKAAYPSLFVEN